MAPPCSSFSNALFWTGRLRSRREPWGLAKGLNAKHRAKVSLANKIVRPVFACGGTAPGGLALDRQEPEHVSTLVCAFIRQYRR